MDEVKDFTDDFVVVEDKKENEIERRNNELDFETDHHRIQQRQRQIDFGKNTIGYQRYLEQYPVKRKRPRHLPKTPDVRKKCSKRSFAGQIRAWRRRLHEWDLPNSEVDDSPMVAGKVQDSPNTCEKWTASRGFPKGTGEENACYIPLD